MQLVIAEKPSVGVALANVNMFTGNTFETEYNQGKKSERAWAKVRKISDDICRENKLSVIENAETRLSILRVSIRLRIIKILKKCCTSNSELREHYLRN